MSGPASLLSPHVTWLVDSSLSHGTWTRHKTVKTFTAGGIFAWAAQFNQTNTHTYTHYGDVEEEPGDEWPRKNEARACNALLAAGRNEVYAVPQVADTHQEQWVTGGVTQRGRSSPRGTRLTWLLFLMPLGILCCLSMSWHGDIKLYLSRTEWRFWGASRVSGRPHCPVHRRPIRDALDVPRRKQTQQTWGNILGWEDKLVTLRGVKSRADVWHHTRGEYCATKHVEAPTFLSLFIYVVFPSVCWRTWSCTATWNDLENNK